MLLAVLQEPGRTLAAHVRARVRLPVGVCLHIRVRVRASELLSEKPADKACWAPPPIPLPHLCVCLTTARWEVRWGLSVSSAIGLVAPPRALPSKAPREGSFLNQVLCLHLGLQCGLVQEDSTPAPPRVSLKHLPLKRRVLEPSTARAAGLRFGVKGQRNGNSAPPPTLHGPGPVLWRPCGASASPQIPEASWLSLQHLDLHWGEGGSP